jgi:hypothetical protein
MADSSTKVAVAGTGDDIDEESLTVNAVTVKRQRIQIAGAAAAEIVDVNNAQPAQTEYGLVTRAVNPELVLVEYSPTVDTAVAYSIDDYMGVVTTPPTITLGRQNGGSGFIEGITVMDKAKLNLPMELWLFDTTFTAPANNAAWTVTDTEVLNLIAHIGWSNYAISALNSVAVLRNLHQPFKCGASTTSVYVAVVVRATAGAAFGSSSDIKIRLWVSQN